MLGMFRIKRIFEAKIITDWNPKLSPVTMIECPFIEAPCLERLFSLKLNTDLKWKL